MKPPKGGKEIGYHTDTAYIPWPEVTCWIALDDVSAATGTLEYVKGSHKWTKYKDKLSTNTFHAPSNDFKSALEHAAEAEGIDKETLSTLVRKVEVPAGGCAFHNGDVY
jgi:ectoine hydroxylase-related dioxygenase (phytanoyl-CoA dioxygenase family)